MSRTLHRKQENDMFLVPTPVVNCSRCEFDLFKARLFQDVSTVQSPARSWVGRDVPSADLDHVLVGREKELGGVGHIRGRVGSDPRVALGLGRECEQEGLPRAEVRLLTLLPLGRAVGPKALRAGERREHMQQGLGTFTPKNVRCMKIKFYHYCETSRMHPCRNQYPIPIFKV